MGRECQYSFADLFRAAKGRDWSAAEQAEFDALDQAARNQWVRKLAAESESFVTEDRRSCDGLVYTAFWRG